MRTSSRIGAAAAATIAFGITVGGSATPAQAVVSGFSIVNTADGYCLNYPGPNKVITEVPCNKNSASQRWTNVTSQLHPRSEPLSGWCLKAPTTHEGFVTGGSCGGTATSWSLASLNDNAVTPIGSRTTCGYLKLSHEGSSIRCGAIDSLSHWKIDY